MILVPIYSKEKVTEFIKAIELTSPKVFENKDQILKELIEFSITSQLDAQSNVVKEQPHTGDCCCMGGPNGCSMCNCSLVWNTYNYRYHIYMHYFYSDN